MFHHVHQLLDYCVCLLFGAEKVVYRVFLLKKKMGVWEGGGEAHL